jgi:CubicO group peptidase (beta-lactamase class C family)
MRILTTISAAAMLAAGMAGAAAAEAPDTYAPARRAILELMEANKLPSVSVAVFRNGHIDWEESFGWADKENRVKATPHTTYSLASISKSFTATGLMTLVAKGAVDLDKPANAYLGTDKIIARIGNANDATVRRIADHTSGLPFHGQFFYADTEFRRPSSDDTIRKFGQIISRPGERYHYSNLGYGILDTIVARESGKSFASYMKQAVFDPLDLKETSVGVPTSPKVVVAVRYATDGAKLPYYDTDHPGASEVFSSAHDLIRFAAFHMKAHLPEQRAILSDALIDQMHVNSARESADSGYGIGFSTSTRNGYTSVSHGGSMPGVATNMITIPAQGIAIVVLSNSWQSPVVSEITSKIAATIVPNWPAGPRTPPTPAEKPFAPPPALAGKWTGHVARPEGDLPVTMTVDAGGSITATFGDRAPVTLTNAAFADDRLSGQLATLIPSKDTARYPHQVRLDIKLEGDRLYGAAIALDDFKNQKFAAGLTYWIDLHHAP